MMTSRIKSVFRLAAVHLGLVCGISLILRAFLDIFFWRSFLLGGVFFAISFLMLGLSWTPVFSKKYIALAVSVSVFKWSFLGIILYGLVVGKLIHPLFFGTGCSVFVLAALVEAVAFNKPDAKEE